MKEDISLLSIDDKINRYTQSDDQLPSDSQLIFISSPKDS